jgi:hypothetical protein
MITDALHADRMLRLKLARAEYERTSREFRLLQYGSANQRRANGTKRIDGLRHLRDRAGDELQRALEEACE